MLLRRLPAATGLGVAGLRPLHVSVAPRRPAEPPLEPSFIQKYKLDEPSRFVPIAAASAVAATATGVYHVDAETQILGLFILFTGTIYLQGGSAIGKFLDDQADAIQKEQTALEDAQLAAAKVAMQAHHKQATVFGDIQAVFEGQVGLMNRIVETQNLKLKHELRNKVARQLDHLVSAEQTAKARYEREVVDQAVAFVRQAMLSPRGAAYKAQAMKDSLAVLKDHSRAKKPDAVTALLSAFFAGLERDSKATKGKEVPLSEAAKSAATEAAKAVARRDGLEGLALPQLSSVRL